MSGGGRIGVVGLGIMGSAIARNLVSAGFAVTGFDIEEARNAELRRQGGDAAGSVAELAARTDVILTSLPNPAALDATAASLVGIQWQGRILAELSTLKIDDKQRASAILAQSGIVMLDCPLSGTGAQAATRDLAVFASGDRDSFDCCGEIFSGFARAIHYVGAFGNGSRMKFIANLLVAIHNVASAEAMVLGMKAGLDPRQIVEVIASGAGNSRIFELRAPMMAERRYEPPTMKLGVWQKDMAIIGEFAAAMGVVTPLFTATKPIYDATIAQGLSDRDTAAVCTILEALAGLPRE